MAINSTLSTELGKSTATPILLLQLSILQPWKYFVIDSAGIWRFSTLTNEYSGIDPELTDGFPTLNIVGIGDVLVDGTPLTEVTNYTNTVDGRATALSVEPSFIFDGVNDILYVRFDDDYNPPLAKEITIGAILGLSDSAYYDYVNDINYVPDLNNSPNITQRKDPIFFQTLRFDNFNQQINNAHYLYDQYRTSGIFGSLAEYYIGERSLAFEYFEKIYEGRVTKYSYNRDTWTLTIRDARKELSNRIPFRVISSTTYPYADDYSYSQPIPFLYGTVTDSPCICLNENQTTPSSYSFIFGDATDFDFDVTGAVIKVNGTAVTPTAGPTGTTGLFTLSTSDYSPGDTVTYSGLGYTDSGVISNQLDIVKHLLENYASITYNTTNFNTIEWAAETLLAPDVGIAITDYTSVISVIEKIASTNAAGFLKEQDGRFTWRTFNASSPAAITIYDTDWQDHPRLVGDADEVLSSATVKYDQSISSGRWKRQTDDSKETTVKQDYNIQRNREFDTLYYNSSDALSFAQDIMSRSDSVKDIIEGTVRLDKIEGQIGQNAQIELDHTDGSAWLGTVKCEILETSPDIASNRLKLKLRAFETLDNFTIIHDFNGDSSTTIFDFNSADATIIDYNGG